MSGITPILDTLLHQVLGKRADFQQPRGLNEPVRPTQPIDAATAVRSDSRLDPRALARFPLTSNETVGRSAPPAPPLSGGTASASTHFTAAARAIADVLSRLPGPPPPLGLRQPLLRPGEAAGAALVASRLQGSIEQSGLFYEAHLARWYRGEVPRRQLETQPQMLLADPARAGVEPVAEPLQTMVRHQLELLAAPVLRWEGDVWSGIFLALAIHLPDESEQREGGDGGGIAEDRSEQSELLLKVADLGDIRIKLSVGPDRLVVALSASRADLVERMQANRDGLESRLGACGFRQVLLSVDVADAGDE